MTNQQTYKIEDIIKRRQEKKTEIKQSKERMLQLTEELFVPQKSKNKIEGIIQHVNAGIATYDGIMTGFKILKRIRFFFSRKTDKK